MSENRAIDNVEAMEFARDHPLTAILLGRICHVTTPKNLLSILEDGYIRVNTSRNGILVRREDAPPSTCMRHDAVSVFDFGVDNDLLFPMYQRLEDVYSYDMHWWNYLCLKPASVAILLNEKVRKSFVPTPSLEGQFIRGTEFCHKGDISDDCFDGFIFIDGSPWEIEKCKINRFSRDQSGRLIEDLNDWITSMKRENQLLIDYGFDPNVMTSSEIRDIINFITSGSAGSTE